MGYKVEAMITLTALTESEVEAIHHATLRILSETGILLGHPLGRELLCSAGALIAGENVLLPPDMVESAITRCAREVRLRSRKGTIKVWGDGGLHWHNLGGARDIYDPLTGRRRRATLQDLRDSTRLMDALDHVTSITPMFTPQDVYGPSMSLAMYRHALPHTTKVLQGPGVHTAAEVRYAARLAAAIGPPEEILSLSVSPVSPLTFPDDVVEAILETARLNITFAPLPCPTAGTTAPLSIAGALAQQSAEVLAAIVLAQVAHPGLPIIYCGRLAMMEPRTGHSVWGGVELGLASAATAQIGHRLGLPVNVYGFSSNAHTLDIQSGFERALNAAIPALAGADELSGIGEMEAGVMSSFAQIVCDNELAASVKRLQRGFAVDEDACAVEIVATAMHGTRNYLGQKHTSRYLRGGEILLARLAERGTWESWEAGERKGMAERAQEEAERLLLEHSVPPLSEDQETELDAILDEASSALK
jgi:trimethylamine--corrinoid protein Co-methyltransferase